MHFTTSLIFISASLLAAGGVQAARFAETCTGTRLQGNNIMFASCLDGNGVRSAATSLDLNACIVNRNGFLSCEANGNYAVSCSGCTVLGARMTCSCPGRIASINLNDCVSNLNGIISCP